MYKQIIIVRRDLNMSPGKLAAQVSHASMAFLTNPIRQNAVTQLNGCGFGANKCYTATLYFNPDMYEQWIEGSFTKIVLGARNKDKLIDAMYMADELGIECYPIWDNCRTELEPEEGDGTTLTCVGFPPLDSEVIDKIGRKYHLL